MYEHMGTLGAPLYGLVPERLGNKNASYGGIGAKASGENPGLIYLGMGATGKFCNNVSYKVQTAYLWYDEEDALGLSDDEIGWTVDALVKYPLTSNVGISFATSFLLPGDGVYKDTSESLGGVSDDDIAWITRFELCWKW